MYLFFRIFSFKVIYVFNSLCYDIRPGYRMDVDSYFMNEGLGNLDYVISPQPTLMSSIGPWYMWTTESRLSTTTMTSPSDEVPALTPPTTTKSYFFNPEIFHTPTLRDKTMFYFDNDLQEQSSYDFFEFIKSVTTPINTKMTLNYADNADTEILRQGIDTEENFNVTTEGLNLTTNNETIEIAKEEINNVTTNLRLTTNNTLLTYKVNEMNITTELLTRASRQGKDYKENFDSTTEKVNNVLTTNTTFTKEGLNFGKIALLSTKVKEMIITASKASRQVKENKENFAATTEMLNNHSTTNVPKATEGLNFTENTPPITVVKEINITELITKALRKEYYNRDFYNVTANERHKNVSTNALVTTEGLNVTKNTTTIFATNARRGNENRKKIEVTTKRVNSNSTVNASLIEVVHKRNTTTIFATNSLRQGNENEENFKITTKEDNLNLTTNIPVTTAVNKISRTTKLAAHRKDFYYDWMPIFDTSTTETTTIHYIVHKAKTLMSESKIRFMTAFTIHFCDIVRKWESAYAKEIANSLHASVTQFAAAGKLLPLGNRIQELLLYGALYIKHHHIPYLQNDATSCVAVLSNTKGVVPDDCRALIAEFEELYTFEEGDAVLQTLPLAYEYPHNGKQAKEVTDNILDAILRPFHRLVGTNKLYNFISNVEEVLDYYDVRIH